MSDAADEMELKILHSMFLHWLGLFSTFQWVLHKTLFSPGFENSEWQQHILYFILIIACNVCITVWKKQSLEEFLWIE